MLVVLEKDDTVVMRTHSGYQKHQKQVVCYKCGQPGHKSNVCESKENKNKVKRSCSNCNMNNHTNNTCRKHISPCKAEQSCKTM